MCVHFSSIYVDGGDLLGDAQFCPPQLDDRMEKNVVEAAAWDAKPGVGGAPSNDYLMTDRIRAR